MHLSRTILSALFLAFAGCDPTCDEACDKLIACDDAGTERMSSAECKEACNQQQELYATWDDTQLRAGFDDELACVKSSTCSDLEAGVCYEDDLWSF